jgi:hypothetical protein
MNYFVACMEGNWGPNCEENCTCITDNTMNCNKTDESLSVTCDSRWFSPGTLFFSTNKIDRHNITEILLKSGVNQMLLSVRTTLNVRILMDLTSVCVIMDTTVLEMFVLVSQIILMDLNFRFRLMVANTTFNNISVILWRSILLVEKIEYPGKTTRCKIH